MFKNLTGWRKLFSIRPTTMQSSPLVLKRRQIFIIPTQSGGWFGLVLLVMLFGSMNYNNSMGYMLTFLLASMTIVSILHTHRTLLGLRIEVGKVAPVFAFETAQFQLWLDNRGQIARHVLVWQHKSSHNHNSSTTIDIPANQRININLPVLATRRGRISLGRVKVSTRFPLGLFYAWAYVHFDIVTMVYPQPLGYKTLPLSQQSENVGEGSPHDGGGEDFIGYRDYQLGDSPRHIDWKAVAREQELMIKQFGGMSAAQVWLTWDDVRTLNNTEAALSQLCLWILVAESQRAQYGLKIPNCTFEPDTGELHRERCLQALALFKGT